MESTILTDPNDAATVVNLAKHVGLAHVDQMITHRQAGRQGRLPKMGTIIGRGKATAQQRPIPPQYRLAAFVVESRGKLGVPLGRDAVGKLINLPDDHVIAMFVTIGKAIKEARPRAGQLSMSEVVVENRF